MMAAFPPSQTEKPANEWSLWNELSIAHTLVAYLILDSFCISKIMSNLQKLPQVCANSKRNRLQAIQRFLLSG
jgi:hypothetical protein